MAAVHPTPARLEALRSRWEGQEHRLRAIAEDMRAGRDWTVHVRGLPYATEVPPLPGEAYGRDLRGANLRRHLRPPVEVRVATEGDAARIVGISMEALRNNTALPDGSPFPTEIEGVEAVGLAIRRGERFLIAICGEEPAGVVRTAVRREFDELTYGRPYVEISNLAVRMRWRGAGIGARLLAEAETLAEAGGHETALLRTTLEVGLVPWYERLGYAQRRVRQLTYEGAPTFLDVLMTKPVGVQEDPPIGLTQGRPRLLRHGGGGRPLNGTHLRAGGASFAQTFR